MVLPNDQIETMTRSILKEWVNLQTQIFAHRRKRASDERNSGLLSWGTIIAAIATAVSTGFPSHISTVLVAVLTAALAAAEKRLTPASNIELLWKQERKLEASKNHLAVLVRNLPIQKNIATAQTTLGQIIESALESIGLQVSETSEDRAKAEAESCTNELFIGPSYGSSQQFATGSSKNGESTLDEDASDVIPTRRRKV